MAHTPQSSVFGQMIWQYRVRVGLTQQELARRAGLSVRALRDIEQDRVARPRAPSVHRLATALRLSAGDQAQLLRMTESTAAWLSTPPHVDVVRPLSVYRSGGAVTLAPPMRRTVLQLQAVPP